MSPVAVGSPHTRASPIDGGRPVSMTTNGARVNGTDGLKGANRVFPHLDDLVSVKPDVDINTPLRRILEYGEAISKQADTSLDFRRPDVALQEYLRASKIFLDVVPRHKDYPAINTDRGDLHRLYIGLRKRLNLQHNKFAEVKEVIKENNARSGVTPSKSNGSAASGTSSDGPGGVDKGAPSQTQSVDSGQMNGNASPGPTQKKTAPPVHPKPDALHGKSISHAPGSGNVSDLAARFARLQNNGPGQDPRINTRPISIPDSSKLNGNPPAKPESRSSMVRPQGPREFPSVPKTQPRLTNTPQDVKIPGMPRPPDAIHHSPLRAAENSDTANLPSSVPRNPSFLGSGRKNSAPPISTVGPSPYSFDNRSEYFVSPADTSNDYVAQVQNKRSPPSLPTSKKITAEELYEYLGQGQQVLKLLLVDLRSRQDFENGHIMAQSIICVEPITLRAGISGDELEDSMVIAPNYEQDLFEQRQDFDLVVFYDQSSEDIKGFSLGKDADSVLRDFSAAVYDYGYDKRLKRRPVLLAGGLDAWTDLLGPNSLKTSGGDDGALGSASHLSKSSARQFSQRPQATSISKRKARPSRLKSKEEERKWDEALREEGTITGTVVAETPVSDDLVYARTTEDFFRRFPEISVQESMVSPVAAPSKQSHYQLDSAVPQPPARPAPALPRQRSSGISEKGPTMHYTHAAVASISRLVTQPGRTGLNNPGNLCYMNSAIQGLSAIKPFREYLINLRPGGSGFVNVPKKKGESAPPMQLMAKSLGDLLGHMWSGQYNFLTPKTYRGYVNALHATSNHDANLNEKLRVHAFGGISRQHDSAEFLAWLLEVLDDELNPRRNIAEVVPTDATYEQWGHEPEIMAAQKALANRLINQNSFLTMQMKSLVAEETACPRNECHYKSRQFQLNNILNITVPVSAQPVPLFEMLTAQVGGTPETASGFTCPACKQQVDIRRKITMAHMPNILFIQLLRSTGGGKAHTQVTFPETVDLSPLLISTKGANTDNLDHGFRAPFIYDVVAVTTHAGNSTTSGHYWTTSRNIDARDGSGSQWYKISDDYISDVDFDSTQKGTATFLYLQRRNPPAASSGL